MPVARLSLLDAELWLWSQPGRVGRLKLLKKQNNVNYTFCDQVFGEMELDGQLIGLAATQISLFLQAMGFN